MGLLDVLTFPVMGPVRGVSWIAEKILEQAEAEFYDPVRVRQKLEALELDLDMGRITEAQYMDAEEELLARLRLIREYQADASQS